MCSILESNQHYIVHMARPGKSFSYPITAHCSRRCLYLHSIVSSIKADSMMNLSSKSLSFPFLLNKIADIYESYHSSLSTSILFGNFVYNSFSGSIYVPYYKNCVKHELCGARIFWCGCISVLSKSFSFSWLDWGLLRVDFPNYSYWTICYDFVL